MNAGAPVASAVSRAKRDVAPAIGTCGVPFLPCQGADAARRRRGGLEPPLRSDPCDLTRRRRAGPSIGTGNSGSTARWSWRGVLPPCSRSASTLRCSSAARRRHGPSMRRIVPAFRRGGFVRTSLFISEQGEPRIGFCRDRANSLNSLTAHGPRPFRMPAIVRRMAVSAAAARVLFLHSRTVPAFGLRAAALSTYAFTSHPSLGVGVHLPLVDGTPTLPPNGLLGLLQDGSRRFSKTMNSSKEPLPTSLFISYVRHFQRAERRTPFANGAPSA